MLLLVQNLKKQFGIDVVLDGVSFRVDRREKVGLIGRNGCGKTTILKAIAGLIEPDSGTVQLAKGATVGFLRQEHAVTAGRSVLQEAESGLGHDIELRARLLELESRLENGPTEEELEEYALVHEHFLEAEGYSLDHDVRTVLTRMGFSPEEFDKPTDVLSGGEKTRLAIARLLLEEPDLLILDEPTNHLDLDAAEWLERWIAAYHGAVLVVSHDRRFLENTVQKVIEARDGKAKTYDADFAGYLKLRAADEARQTEVAARQAAEIAKLDEFVRRFMNSQRTAQARGREKLMNRLIAGQIQAPENQRGMAAGFAKAQRSGDQVIECEGLAVGFDGAPLFPPLDWTVRYGERWGVVGENGAGKSTLIKAVMGEVEPMSGRCRLGSKVVCGYFHQDVADLDPEATPLEYLVYEADMDTASARDLLGRFLFSGDDVMRRVKSLSGGEKNKLVLARLTQLNPNLLVLDEPTNHLDMDSREALADVLNEFTGTLVLVSHDRFLLERTTRMTLDVRSSGAILFPGPFADYRAGRTPPQVSAPTVKPEAKPDSKSHRELSKDITRLEKAVVEIEEDVTAWEAEVRRLEDELANVAPTADILEMVQQHRQAQERLESSLAAWEEQSARLEGLRKQQGPADHEPGVVFRSTP